MDRCCCLIKYRCNETNFYLHTVHLCYTHNVTSLVPRARLPNDLHVTDFGSVTETSSPARPRSEHKMLLPWW